MASPPVQTTTKQGHPSGDERYKAIDRTMDRFNYEKDALLEVLNSAQETFGYLSEDLLYYVSNQLRVPLAQVCGVATFYHMFTFTPLGKNNCIVCTGTACHVKGANRIVEQVTEALHVQPGQTTPDGLFSLTTARCLGSCGLAPVVVMNGKVRGKETPEAVARQARELIDQSEVSMQAEPEAE